MVDLAQLLHFLLPYHFVDLLLADGLSLELVACVEVEGLGYRDSVLAFLAALGRLRPLFVVLGGQLHVAEAVLEFRALRVQGLECGVPLVGGRLFVVNEILSLLEVLQLGVLHRLSSLLAHFERLEVFFLFHFSHDSLVPSALSFLVGAFSALLSLSFPAVFLDELGNLVLAQGSSSLGEELDHGGPVNLLGLQLSLHSVEHLLESLSGLAGVALRVSRDGAVNCSDLRVLSDCHEEGQNGNCVLVGALARNGVVNVLDQLELLFRNVDLVGWSQLGQLLQAALLLLFHESLDLGGFVRLLTLSLVFLGLLHSVAGLLFVASIDFLVVGEVS